MNLNLEFTQSLILYIDTNPDLDADTIYSAGIIIRAHKCPRYTIEMEGIKHKGHINLIKNNSKLINKLYKNKKYKPYIDKNVLDILNNINNLPSAEKGITIFDSKIAYRFGTRGGCEEYASACEEYLDKVITEEDARHIFAKYNVASIMDIIRGEIIVP